MKFELVPPASPRSLSSAPRLRRRHDAPRSYREPIDGFDVQGWPCASLAQPPSSCSLVCLVPMKATITDVAKAKASVVAVVVRPIGGGDGRRSGHGVRDDGGAVRAERLNGGED
nr:unnamed protein product [Digitaria exilis]